MENDIDPYAYADELSQMANDLLSDMTSFTVQDISEVLRDAARYIEHLADDHNSYVARTKVTLTVGHEVMDLTDEILPMINTTLLHEWIRDAVVDRLNGGHGHTHSH